MLSQGVIERNDQLFNALVDHSLFTVSHFHQSKDHSLAYQEVLGSFGSLSLLINNCSKSSDPISVSSIHQL